MRRRQRLYLNPLAYQILANVSISLSSFWPILFVVTLYKRFNSPSCCLSVYSSRFCISFIYIVSQYLPMTGFLFIFTIWFIHSIDVVSSIHYCSLLFVHIITMNDFYLQLFGFESTFLILRFFIFQLLQK